MLAGCARRLPVFQAGIPAPGISRKGDATVPIVHLFDFIPAESGDFTNNSDDHEVDIDLGTGRGDKGAPR